MTKCLFRLLPGLFLASVCSTAFSALSQDPSLHWRTLTTTHFEIHFHDGEEALAHEVADISEQVHSRLAAKLNWQPAERTQVVLTDRFDFANGSASPLPRNEMRLLMTPPEASSVLADYDDWLRLLITHEYTHILHLDKRSGLPDSLQSVFGRLLFLFPNLLQPPWFIEGLATYEETDRTRGIGRGQGTGFRGLMRLEVANGIKPLQQVNQPLVSWPMNTVRYLYGVYFYQFIAERYGADKVGQLVEEYSDNLIPFAINSNSNKVLGKKLDPLWEEFNTYLQQQFQPEIQQIQQRGEVAGEQLSHTGYLTASPQVAANGDVFYLANDMQSEPRLMRLVGGKGKPQVVADARGQDFDLHPTAGIVLAELNAVRNTNIFSDLIHIDPATGQRTQLTHGQRYRYASWSPDGRQLIAVHNEGGQSALHLLDSHGTLLDTLWQGTDHTVLGPPDWSPDGRQLVLSVWRPGSLWNLESFDLATRQWQQLTQGPAIEATPRYSADGHSILFSADYDGVFNLRRLDLASGQITTLSNVLGSAGAPAENPNKANDIYYIGANGQGYDLYHLAAAQPLATVTMPTPASDKPHTLNTAGPVMENHSGGSIEDYNALPRIRPTSWFPYFQFDDIRSEIGFTTWGRDPLNRHVYNALMAYDTDYHWLVGQINYIYDRWNPTLKLAFNREALAYLDTAGKLERFRNSDTVSVEAEWPFLRYQRQWLLHAGVVSETETDKKILSSFGPVSAFHDRLAGLALSYNSAHRYARAISPSHGRRLRLVAEDNELLDSDYSGQVYTLDWREFIDLPGQHVFAARGVLGWGTDSPRSFRLGGQAETSVPANPEAAAGAVTQNIFGHRHYPLRGYPEGRSDLRGRRMALAEAEWRFPLALVERGLMAPPIGIHQLHGTLFYNWGEAWNIENDIPALRRGAGIELTAELVLGYWLPLELRAGYAKGIDLGGEEQTYLELGASF